MKKGRMELKELETKRHSKGLHYYSHEKQLKARIQKALASVVAAAADTKPATYMDAKILRLAAACLHLPPIKVLAKGTVSKPKLFTSFRIPKLAKQTNQFHSASNNKNMDGNVTGQSASRQMATDNKFCLENKAAESKLQKACHQLQQKLEQVIREQCGYVIDSCENEARPRHLCSKHQRAVDSAKRALSEGCSVLGLLRTALDCVRATSVVYVKPKHVQRLLMVTNMEESK